MYGLHNDSQDQCAAAVCLYSLLQTPYQAFSVQYLTSWAKKWSLEALTSFKCSRRCVFMNMHVAYTRIGKQEQSVSTGTRRSEDRKFPIHLQSHCVYKLLENSMEADRLNTFDGLVVWCLLLIHWWTPTNKQHICFSYCCPPSKDN